VAGLIKYRPDLNQISTN